MNKHYKQAEVTMTISTSNKALLEFYNRYAADTARYKRHVNKLRAGKYKKDSPEHKRLAELHIKSEAAKLERSFSVLNAAKNIEDTLVSLPPTDKYFVLQLLQPVLQTESK
jgi:hypothetical protein